MSYSYNNFPLNWKFTDEKELENTPQDVEDEEVEQEEAEVDLNDEVSDEQEFDEQGEEEPEQPEEVDEEVEEEVEQEEQEEQQIEQLSLPTIDYTSFETKGSVEKQIRKSKRFSDAGQLSLEINGHVIFKKLALAENNQSEADRHQGFIDLLLQKAAALNVELKLNPTTGRYRLERPAKVARSLNETVKQQLLGIFDHKISEKQSQINGLGNDRDVIRKKLSENTELTVANMTEITAQLSDLAAKQRELQTQVILLQQLRKEMTQIIIRF